MDHELLKIVWWLLIGVMLISFMLGESLDVGARVLVPWLSGRSGDPLPQAPAAPAHINLLWLLALSFTLALVWPSLGGLACLMTGLLGLLVLLRRSASQAARPRQAWRVLAVGLLPAVLLGGMLGNVLLGLPLSRCGQAGIQFHGSVGGLFSPFALLTGVVSLAMVCQFGAAWVMQRGGGGWYQPASRVAGVAGVMFLASFIVAAIWLATNARGYSVWAVERPATLCGPGTWVVLANNPGWLDNFQAWPAAVLAPLFALSGTVISLFACANGRSSLALLGSGLTVGAVLCSVGLALFPLILPSSVQVSASMTLWSAAGDERTLGTLLIVASVLLPMLLAYTLGVSLKGSHLLIEPSKRVGTRQRHALCSIQGDERIA
ncbi:cytochrome d ubiquinol oxidase subunit II [Pseudomonas sp. NPDC089758]|uniref:cytochrome d ubiquinol oxidase subunit II n=1 Tax=Pseudomonas sp. NPDC089758 TaxID=3364473 RepID=UPI0037F99AF7